MQETDNKVDSRVVPLKEAEVTSSKEDTNNPRHTATVVVVIINNKVKQVVTVNNLKPVVIHMLRKSPSRSS